MDLHYSQTPSRRKAPKRWFYYLMDLHYSQTLFRQLPTTIMFYYLMDLHYSQTTHYKLYKVLGFTTLWIYTILKLIIGRRRSRTPFYYLMDLHYSQTQGILQALLIRFTTLWIYTILKPLSDLRAAVGVLLPYGFTLFSNKIPRSSTFQKFYYLMDLHYSQTPPLSIAITTSFTTLWIYTILKHSTRTGTTADVLLPYGFTLFSNLTGEDITFVFVLLPYGFTLFSNLK